MQNEAPSRLAYFNANAPKEIPSWFKPDMGEYTAPVPLYPLGYGIGSTESLDEAARSIAKADGVPVDVARLKAIYSACNKPKLDTWNDFYAAEAALQWPIYWARQMVKRTEGGAS